MGGIILNFFFDFEQVFLKRIANVIVGNPIKYEYVSITYFNCSLVDQKKNNGRNKNNINFVPITDKCHIISLYNFCSLWRINHHKKRD
jgi:hypothetical protein